MHVNKPNPLEKFSFSFQCGDINGLISDTRHSLIEIKEACFVMMRQLNNWRMFLLDSILKKDD